MVQALEQTAREILTLLQGVHQGPGFQHSESRVATPGQWRTAGGRECPSEHAGALYRGRFSWFQSLPGPSAWVSRERGGRSWEISNQTSSKAAVQHYGTPLCLFLPSLAWGFSIFVQSSVFFSRCSRPGLLSWLLGLFVSGLHTYCVIIICWVFLSVSSSHLFTPDPKKLWS